MRKGYLCEVGREEDGRVRVRVRVRVRARARARHLREVGREEDVR